ncbi:MAG: NAD(P)H-hydrate dehydratase [Polyangia bacterium]|jgi:NAD(P)H-hydrate epimerase
MALVLSAAQMKAVDRAAIDKLGLPGLVLMENAGRGVAEIIAREKSHLSDLDVRVVCGAGQNGGDGFVVARHLLDRGAQVQVFLAMPREKMAGDAAVFARVFEALPGALVRDASFEEDATTWRAYLAGADVIVDAVFGTGLRSDVIGPAAAAIRAMNAVDTLRVAVDIPSGLDADTGVVRGGAVLAHVTATMGCRKLGLVLDPDAPVGRVEVVDLGVPPDAALEAARAEGPLCYWLERAGVARMLPRPGPGAHKGTAGHVLIIAGSAGKTGAALLAARAALRTGAGLATMATTRAGQTALDAKVVAEMTAVYADGDDADGASYARILALAGRMKAAALGPGIPTGPGMAAMVRRLVGELPIPLVVDADALNLLGEDAAALATSARAARVLTPHPGEMARVCGLPVGEISKDRLGHARRLAERSRAVVVLKGARTVIARPDGTAHINPTANPALGTAGSGDVLTGVIASLLGQGLAAPDAACAGVFVHGESAETAIRTLGSHNLMAGDLPDAIARTLEGLRSL